jgi:hypothetical protein
MEASPFDTAQVKPAKKSQSTENPKEVIDVSDDEVRPKEPQKKQVSPEQADLNLAEQLGNYPAQGLWEVPLGPAWKTRPVEMYLKMAAEAAERRAGLQQCSDESCRECGCIAFFEGLTEECCLNELGVHCSFK